MEWGLIASSAITAGIVSAAVNAAFGWARFMAESRDRRNEIRREQLRGAVVDFLAAEADAFDRAGMSIAVAQVLRAIDDDARAGVEPDPSVGGRDKYLKQYVQATQADAAAAKVAWQAIARLRLYSRGLHVLAVALLEQRRNESVHYDPLRDEPPADDRDQALDRFVTATRAELGIAGL